MDASERTLSIQRSRNSRRGHSADAEHIDLAIVKQLLEAVPDAVLVTDSSHKIVAVNDELLELFEYDAPQLIGNSIDMLIPKKLRKRHVAHRESFKAHPVRRAMGATGPGLLFGVRRDGTEFPVEVSLSPIGSDRRQLVVCTVRDLRSRLKLWKELARQKEDLLARVFDAVPAMAFVLESPGLTLRANKSMESTLGWPAQELAERGLRLCLSDARSRVRARKLLKHPEEGLHEFRLQCRDGRFIESLWSFSALSGDSVVAMGIDITEKVELEARLRQSEKMQAIGQLAGGVAHDFNNLLTVISGRAQLLRQRLGDDFDDGANGEVEEILHCAESASSLTRQLLTFSRQEDPKLEILVPRQVIENLEGLLSRLLPEDIEFVVDAERSAGAILADRSHVEQILLNLAINARDAMSEGGRLTIVAEDLDTDEYDVIPWAGKPERYVRLSVTDTGHGMDEVVASHAFEPFFTTKKTGTGLGLATVFGIVDQLHGHVDIESDLGRGTTVRVCLPLAEGPVDEPQAFQQPQHKDLSFTILVVEDSATVRSLIVDVLQGAGHTVLAAQDGAEALSVVEQAEHLPDLVIADVVMPRMSGPTLVQKLRKYAPGLKVIFVSGHVAKGLSSMQLIPGLTGFLAKPFRPASLLIHVEQMLCPPAATGADEPQDTHGQP